MGNSYILKKVTYDFEDWKKDYTEYLEKLYELPVDLYELPENPYNDPDAKEMKHVAFYRDLVSFLNTREKDMEKQLNGKWKYMLINGDTTDKYGIQVYDKNDELFVLFSDQFGFSAPALEKKHPYDYYVELAKEAGEDGYKKAISNVVEWIFNTRSIGGSFLWPRQAQGYNAARGGSKNSVNNSKYYIEDRVDLTLLEIKQIYDKQEPRILYRFWKESKELQQFFNHFGSFDTYIDFFMMDDFVIRDDSDKETMPIDIITGEKLKAEDIEEYKKKKAGIFTLKIDKIEQMLHNVNDLIVKRTRKMQG